MFAVPREQVSRIHASSGTTGKPTVVGYTATRPRQLGQPRGALDPRRRRQRRRQWCTWPTATACSPAASARTTAPSALGCTVIPMSRRADREAGAADPGFPAGHHHGHAELLAGDPRANSGGRASTRATARCGSASSAPSPGRAHMRADIEAKAGHRRGRHLRPVGSDGPGRGQRVRRRTKDGPMIWEDHFYAEIIEPRDGRTGGRRRGRRAGVHLADQGGDADRPLPHARPDAPVAGHGAHACAASARSPAARTT